MLRLLLLRHAEAWHASGVSDVERSLTPAGVAAAARFGAYLKKSGIGPEMTLVSPARRTLETEKEIGRSLGGAAAALIAPILYNASRSTILSLISDTPPTVATLLVIGHNPGLAETANFLTRTGKQEDLQRLRTEFPAPCLAVIDFEATAWTQPSRASGRLNRFITLATLTRTASSA